jgi:hypothetical protein
MRATRQKSGTKETKGYISEQDHGRLLDEITRVEILEFAEAEDDIMDYSGSEGEQSMDDDEQLMYDDEQSMNDDAD